MSARELGVAVAFSRGDDGEYVCPPCRGATPGHALRRALARARRAKLLNRSG